MSPENPLPLKIKVNVDFEIVQGDQGDGDVKNVTTLPVPQRVGYTLDGVVGDVSKEVLRRAGNVVTDLLNR